jgi:pyrroline-5-carboxylate reductase
VPAGPPPILVVEPLAAQRDKLLQAFGVQALPAAGPALAQAGTVVWAVKPQSFAEAAAACPASWPRRCSCR